MYQLGSLFIFDKKLMRVYVGGCNKNVFLSISKNTDGCWEMLFPFSKVFTSTKSYWFWYKGFINNSLKFCPRNFRNMGIDCPLRRKTILSCKNLRKAMLLLYDYVKSYDSEDLKHSKMNYKNVSTSWEYFLMWLAWLI